jgi:two-component system nitrate/nitrite response regulator NarL
MPKVRVLLADDQNLFRRGLATVLASAEDLEVVGEAADGREAVEKTRSLLPDVVLMDLHMPVCDGIQATQLIRAECPQTKVVVLTVSEDDADLFQAISSGAEGYLLKNLYPDELFHFIHRVMAGESPVSPAMASRLLQEIRQPSRRQGPGSASELTPREREILQLVAEGLSNAEIASRLYVVEGTVKNHLHNVLGKLQLSNRVQAAAFALRHGLALSASGSRPG